MSIQNLFDFTRQLENSLEIMLKAPHLPEDEKSDVIRKIELLSEFHNRFELNSTLYNLNKSSL